MEPYELMVTAMFLLFIALLFTGYPIAWLMAGLAVWFTAVGVVFNEFGVQIMSPHYLGDPEEPKTVPPAAWHAAPAAPPAAPSLKSSS